MPEIPDCLRRRYKALDELVNELNSVSHIDLKDDTPQASWNDPGVRLMCEFWNILKENPDYNLTRAVQNHINVENNSMCQPQRYSCYMAAHNCLKKDEDNRPPDSGSGKKYACCHIDKNPVPKIKCCASKSQSSNKETSVVLPLSQVLCNLKEAASFDRKCHGMISDLMSAQKTLQDQIQNLEQREKEGVQLLKQADCMWSCMEDAYKKKIQESQNRQQELIKQLKEAEANANKWRKNKKDLEFQFNHINTCHQEILEKLNQKQNDLKCMNVDIEGYKKRIENNKKEVEAAKKSLTTKKQASEDKIKKILGDIVNKEAVIRNEKAHKEDKENEGNQYIKEARADLLNLNRILLQKKIENEDMKTEKETLIDELELLSQSYDQCKDRCQSKKQSIEDEIKVINKEIANYKVKCARCHQCTDTIDIRKFCTDCPRCVAERDCLYSEDHCNPDHTMDCVCLSVKQKFLDNVFENMYTVLERQIRTGPGKSVAEAVIQCLKKSRNGKLDQSTRHILQDFILTTVKKNLNLTIVGGAVKTRCELDSDTYKQLMLCLKQVKAVRPPKADKETAAKKDPCPRWGGASECNCPKGPKACICTKKAPQPPTDPTPCPPQEKEDAGEVKICPHKESAACGPDCAMHAVPSAVGTDVAAWRPDPCQGPTCQFKNMRAAQCVLGPEALNAISNNGSYVTTVPYVPIGEDQVSCKCESSSTKSCVCKTDGRSHPREKIIEEVMGNYFELTPIEKVSATKEYNRNDIKNNNENIEVPVCVDEPVNIDIKQTKSHVRIQSVNKNCNKLPNNLQTDGLFVSNPNVFKNDFAVEKEDLKIPNKTRNDLYSSKESISVDSHVKNNLIKEQFKPLLISKSIQNDTVIFEKCRNVKKIQRKPSEQSEVLKEINKKVMDLIESITKQDPNSFVSLKKTKSGHLTIGLNSVAYDSGKTFLMKRSASGNMIIEVTDSTIEILKNSKSNIEFNPSFSESSVGKKTDQMGVVVSKSCNEQCNKKKKVTENDVTKFLLHNLKENDETCKVKKEIFSLLCLQDMYEKGQRNIRVRFIYKKKWVADEQATLIQSPSENVMIHVKKIPGIIRTIEEIPVLLFKTESDIVNVCLDEQVSDMFAMRTISEGLLISKKHREAPVEPLQPIETKTEKIAKIKLKGLDSAITEPPVVIEQTPSGNYDIILEKEFEKCYKEAIKRQTGGENDSFFDIINTSSSIVLDFDKIDRVRKESKKAFLMKSNSGVLKIIVSDSTHDDKIKEENITKRKAVASGSTMSAKALRELLSQLHDGSFHKSTPYNAISKKMRSCSDSHLYKTSKTKLQSSQKLLHNSSNTLRRTPSGKFAVILDKESKQTFINNLITLIDKSSANTIPVSRTDSGEITIVFNKDTSNMGNFNSLKVTRSGNIYVVLDGEDFKRIPNNVGVNAASVSSKGVISPYVSQIVNPADKSIATTCNARPDGSLCDSSKCACERFVSLDSWSSSEKCCGKIKCFEFNDQLNIISNRSPHIVIKPRESGLVSDKHARIEESYYCEVQPVCPYHIDRYDAVSNELLEVYGLCNKVQEIRASSKITTHTKARQVYGKIVKSGRDTLDFLPPQLPSFLRNITNINYY